MGEDILAEVGSAVVGMDEPLRTALATICAGGHVLFEDVPGLGKTLAARSLAGALGLEFGRLQCTPDLLPADITGSYAFEIGRASCRETMSGRASGADWATATRAGEAA